MQEMPAFEIEKHVDKILPFLYKKDAVSTSSTS